MTPASPAHRARRAGARRGATLVFVVLLITILIMITGMAVDLARMLTYREQLRNLADAAVLSAATDLARFASYETATTRARALRSHNPLLGGSLGTIGSGDIEGGRWDISSGVFTSSPWSEAGAVRVRASHTDDWTLSRVFGVETQELGRTAIAVVGSQTVSTCLKPLVVPYASLLLRVGQSPGDLAYALTVDDIRLLTAPGTQVTFDLAQGSSASIPGTFGWVELPPIVSSNKNIHMANQLRPGCVNDPVTHGDILTAFSGNMSSNEIQTALRELCPTVPESTNMARQCIPAPTVQLPLYDQTTGTGSGALYRVRYIGAMTLRSIDMSGSNSRLTGELTSITATTPRGFSPAPGPIRMAGLVY